MELGSWAAPMVTARAPCSASETARVLETARIATSVGVKAAATCSRRRQTERASALPTNHSTGPGSEQRLRSSLAMAAATVSW